MFPFLFIIDVLVSLLCLCPSLSGTGGCCNHCGPSHLGRLTEPEHGLFLALELISVPTCVKVALRNLSLSAEPCKVGLKVAPFSQLLVTVGED